MKISRNRRKRAAFTLAEVTMALAVIGTMGAGCYVGFNSLNQYAVSSRLYTEAQTCAQNQIDLILSKGPFDPTATPPKVPAVLGGGTCFFSSRRRHTRLQGDWSSDVCSSD